jgi:predicted secreted protein
VALFAMLPNGLPPQDVEGNVTLGTTPSAPRGAHVRWAVLRTTIVAVLIYGAWFVATRYWGLSFDDVPHFGPNFY